MKSIVLAAAMLAFAGGAAVACPFGMKAEQTAETPAPKPLPTS